LEVLCLAIKALINSIIAYIAGENAILIEVVEQSNFYAALVLPAASILEAKQSAFLRACSSTCFRIFLFCSNCEITAANNFLLLLTFF
jgi:hypothetical protein